MFPAYSLPLSTPLTVVCVLLQNQRRDARRRHARLFKLKIQVQACVHKRTVNWFWNLFGCVLHSSQGFFFPFGATIRWMLMRIFSYWHRVWNWNKYERFADIRTDTRFFFSVTWAATIFFFLIPASQRQLLTACLSHWSIQEVAFIHQLVIHVDLSFVFGMFRSVTHILTVILPLTSSPSKWKKTHWVWLTFCFLFACDSLSLIVFILPRIAEFVLKAHKVKSFLLFNSLDLFIDLLGNTLLFCN